MHYTANVVIKLQHFSGDAAGNLNGNFGVYSSPTSGMAIGNINVQAQVVAGVDPITSLHVALASRADMPAMVEVADAPVAQPTMYPTSAPVVAP